MSPVARRSGGLGHTGRAVAVAVLGVGLALGGAFVVSSLASRGDVQVRLGDDRFNAGNAPRLLDSISAQDAPIGFNDVATFTRPIWVDNLGDDPDDGWIALSGLLPDEPDCLVQWDRDAGHYTTTVGGSCQTSVTFPRSGDGLRRYPTAVVDDRLFVDLRTG